MPDMMKYPEGNLNFTSPTALMTQYGTVCKECIINFMNMVQEVPM